MRRAATARPRDEQGFTLVELMVVVLIIGVLLGIAIPSFLSARSRASDRLAQTSLRVALTNAKSLFSDTSSYLPADRAGLAAVERGVDFIDASTASDDGRSVSVASTSATSWVAAAWSNSGKCFFLYDTGGTEPTKFLAASDVDCSASAGAANVSRFNTDGWA
ncbi:MAG: type pilus assembly protein PilA [Actinomycetota bacterium]|jgi:type IV pilus assembly protein PilA|nr:type pilus assembly protein PilA [Actinomycetota bacterium]